MSKRGLQYLIPAALFLSISSLAQAEEVTIAIADIPAAVTHAVKSKYPNAEIIKAEKEMENGTIEKYEIKLKLPDGKEHDVEVSPTGQIVND